jgi:hypothetical protein
LAGSHRAPRGGGRAAAREARRQKARKRNQTIAAGAAVVVLVGGGGVAALNAFGGDNSPGQKAGSGLSDDKSSDSSVLADDKALLDAVTAKPLAATGAWAVTKTADGSTAPDKVFACQTQRFADPAGLRTWVRTVQNATTKDTAVQYVEVEGPIVDEWPPAPTTRLLGGVDLRPWFASGREVDHYRSRRRNADCNSILHARSRRAYASPGAIRARDYFGIGNGSERSDCSGGQSYRDPDLDQCRQRIGHQRNRLLRGAQPAPGRLFRPRGEGGVPHRCLEPDHG